MKENLKLLLFFVLTLFCQNSWQVCNVPPGWQFLSVEENLEVGTVFNNYTENILIKSVDWIPGNSEPADQYLDIIDQPDFKAIQIKQAGLSDLLDCNVNVDANAGANTIQINGQYLMICNDDSEQPMGDRIYLLPVNNRPPKFGQSSYSLVNVSRQLPGGRDLLKIYSDEIEIVLTDIDRVAQGQMPQEVSIEIQDDTRGLFEPTLSTVLRPFQFCSDLGNGDDMMGHLVGLTLTSDIPEDIESPYSITMISRDEAGNEDMAELTIDFKLEDLMPPVFDEEYYYADITDPNFAGETLLIVQPNPISAHDGDVNIDEGISYSLSSDACPDSFDIEDTTGEISWIKELVKDCLVNGNVFVQVEACQDENINKCSSTTLTIRVLGIENNPAFDRSIYNAQELNPSAKPGDEVMVTDGPIEANIDNPLGETVSVEYELDNPGGQFKLESNDKAKIILDNTFDLEGQGTFVLSIKAFNRANPLRNTFASVVIPYDIPSPTTTTEGTTTGGETTTTSGETTTAGGDTTTSSDIETTTAGGDTTTESGDTTTAGGDTTTAGGDTTTAGGDTTTTPEKPPEGCVMQFEQSLYPNFEIDEGTTFDIQCHMTKVVFVGSGCPEEPAVEPEYDIFMVLPETMNDIAHFKMFDSGNICHEVLNVDENAVDVSTVTTIQIEARASGFATATAIAVFTLVPQNNHEPEVVNADFTDSGRYVFGYPDFVFLETFVQMPLGQVQAVDKDKRDRLSYVLESADKYGQDSLDKFTIDQDTGMIYALPSDNGGNLGDLCEGTACMFKVNIRDQNGLGSMVQVDVSLVPLSEDKIIPIEVDKDDFTNAQDFIDKLNEKFSSKVTVKADMKWFRLIHYTTNQALDSDKARLYLTARKRTTGMVGPNTFLDRDALQNLFDADEDLGDTVDISDDMKVHAKDNVNESGESLLAAVIVLAVLLALAIGGFVVFIFFVKLRHGRYLQPLGHATSAMDLVSSEPSRATTPGLGASPRHILHNNDKVEKSSYIENQLNVQNVRTSGKKAPPPPPPYVVVSPPPSAPPLQSTVTPPSSTSNISDRNRGISFNENAEVIKKSVEVLEESSTEDDDSDTESGTGSDSSSTGSGGNETSL